MDRFRSGAIAMLAEKVIKMGAQLATMILMARYLGADGLGDLMYCYAVASVFLFLNNFGLNSLMIKWLAEHPEGSRGYLKNAFIIRILASVISMLLTNGVGLFLVDDGSRALLFIISLYHLIMPVSIIEWYFQAKGRSSFSAYGLIAGTILGFGVRIGALISGADIVWLGAAYSIELIIVALVYLYLWKRLPEKRAESEDAACIRSMVQQAMPLLLSGAVIMLYMRIDQLMLGYMAGDAEVGLYTAALRLSEAWYFVGLTILGVYFPRFLQVRKELGQVHYAKGIIKIGRILIWGAVLLGAVTTWLADWIIDLFYGETFLSSADVLIVSIWAVVFVYMGAISSQMFVADGKQILQLYRSLLALLINVVLNYILIPVHGAFGAAVALLIAQMFAGLIFNLIKNWDVFRVQLAILYLGRVANDE